MVRAEEISYRQPWQYIIFIVAFSVVVLLASVRPLMSAENIAKITYGQAVEKARVLMEQGQLEEAYLSASAAISIDKKRWEAYAIIALTLGARGNAEEAMKNVDTALELAPDNKKATLQKMRIGFQRDASKNIKTQQLTTEQKDQKTASQHNTSSLSKEARLEHDVLMLIVIDADKSKLQEDRIHYLREFLTKSRDFIVRYPHQQDVWLVRAAAAIEVSDARSGHEAAKKLKEFGLLDSSDPKVRNVVAQLDRVGWLGEWEGLTEDTPPRVPVPVSDYVESFTGTKFVFVKGGNYQMGVSGLFGGTLHDVKIDDFYIGLYEVTQAEWEKVMGGNPSRFIQCGPSCPIESVSWLETQDFIEKLNSISGKNYRLPTEAEWEYAARSGGKNEKWAGISDEKQVQNYAWYDKNSGGRSHRVGYKVPNGLNIYDMTGNVNELCQDWYSDDYYKSSSHDNPTGPINGVQRVMRGGSWNSSASGNSTMTNTTRSGVNPAIGTGSCGFRLAFSALQN